MKGQRISPADVDFWLDTDRYSNLFIQKADSMIFNVDMIRLSSIRKSISNFVRILTRKNIPVYFNDGGGNVNFDGKLIHISAKINTKKDFDVAVGLALHEAAHTVKTDFDIVKIAWANIPHHILALSDSKNISRRSFEKFLHTIWNIIEDRYIDNYVFNEAPGYRGYYVSLYDRYLNCDEIATTLNDPDLFRYPSLESYMFRIGNFTNPATDLNALPRLEDIAKTINISNIDRLRSTKNRIDTAFDVVEIVLGCLYDNVEQPMSTMSGQTKLADPNDYFGDGDEDDGIPNEPKNEGDKEVDVGKTSINEISSILKGNDVGPSENENAVSKISENKLDAETKKNVDEMIQSHREFLLGDIKKDVLSTGQKALLDLVEKHGIILVQIDSPTVLPGNDNNLKIDCIVVQKMTKELVLSGGDIFPLSGAMKIGQDNPDPPEKVADAVKKGILLGTKLGRKLQIRAEDHPVKTIRKKFGKVNKRQIHEAAFDAEDIFYKQHIEMHNDATMHITVDASGSMTGKKWEKTMTAVVAICKAASMIDNIHVTVSFRSTQLAGTVMLPYIVLAYDSKVDKISKIRTLFPYLSPGGYTPEGLAFSAIMNLFEGITPDEEDRYFLNFSDGEPFFHLSVPSSGLSVSYQDDVGSTHTKSQVDKIRRHGVEILSYFIEGGTFITKTSDNSLKKNFRKMYGKNAQFIDVENIVDLARTINGLFLSRSSQKNS